MRLSPENIPTPKDEVWKYTNLQRALPKGLTRADKDQTVLIHKKRGELCAQPEDILFTGLDGVLQNPVLKVILEEGAEMTLIERHQGTGTYWKNISIEIELGANAKLRHYRLLEDSEDSVITLNTQISQERDSAYNGFYFLQKAKLTRNEIEVKLEGIGSSVCFDGVSLLKNSQIGDTTILVEHVAPQCSSSQFFRTVLDDRARGVFQGKVHVHKEAQKTDGYQLSNALILSDTAEMDTKPELEIYADDVKCSHGATTGQLGDESLFYLRSRGLTEAQARKLLIQAFVDEVVDKITDDDFQTLIKEKSEKWLQEIL